MILESSGERFWPTSIEVRTEAKLPPFLDAPAAPLPLNKHQVQLRLTPATEEYGPISHYWLVVVPSNEVRPPAQLLSPRERKGRRVGLGPLPRLLHVLRARLPQRLRAGRAPGQGLHHRQLQPLLPHRAVSGTSLHPTQDPYSSPFRMHKSGGDFKLGLAVSVGGFTNRQLLQERQYQAFMRAFVNKTGENGRPLYVDSLLSPAFSTKEVKETPVRDLPSLPLFPSSAPWQTAQALAVPWQAASSKPVVWHPS